MGLVRNLQIACGVYKAVTGFLGRNGKEKAEAGGAPGNLLGTGAAVEAPVGEGRREKAGELVRLDKSAAGLAGALAWPMLKRAGRTAIKGGIVIGVGVLAFKVLPSYIRRKAETEEED